MPKVDVFASKVDKLRYNRTYRERTLAFMYCKSVFKVQHRVPITTFQKRQPTKQRQGLLLDLQAMLPTSF